MVKDGRADDRIASYLEWTTSGSTSGSGPWGVHDDEVGEEEGVNIDRSRPISLESPLAEWGCWWSRQCLLEVAQAVQAVDGVWSGAVLDSIGRGGVQDVAKLWSRSGRTAAAGLMILNGSR